MLKALKGPGAFRLMLASLVFVHHASRFNIGNAAVLVFFVLSGYWISLMWQTRYAKAAVPYQTYIISRAWRLLPVFLACSALTWLGIVIRHEVLPPNLNLFSQAFSNILILGYHSLSYQANVPAWSLDVELQFYFLAPVMIMAIMRSRWTLPACLLISLGAALLGDHVSALPYLVFFAAGAAAQARTWQPSTSLAWASTAVAAVLVALCLLSPWRSILLVGAHPGPFSAYNPAANILLGVLMAPWGLYTTRQASGAFDRMLGELSFLVYLLHWPALKLVDSGAGSYGRRAVAFVGCFIGVVMAALVLWRWLDRPLERMRHQFVRRRMKKPDPALRSLSEAT